MLMDRIRSFRLAEPFAPFKIEFVDGTTVIVEKPFDIAVATDNSHGMVSSNAMPKRIWPRELKAVELVQTARAGTAE